MTYSKLHILEREMATHSSILSWEIPTERSLVGYSPWGGRELDTMKRLSKAPHLVQKTSRYAETI